MTAPMVADSSTFHLVIFRTTAAGGDERRQGEDKAVAGGSGRRWLTMSKEEITSGRIRAAKYGILHRRRGRYSQGFSFFFFREIVGGRQERKRDWGGGGGS